MNKKLLLQDLTDQLSESAKLKKKDAEEFIKAFFKVIEDSLFEGEVVKIPGLGTFKLIQVDSRKSVDVSTGEEIEIKEHFKIAFIPDQTLKELVNTPFSYLEPVQLDGKAEESKPIEQKRYPEKNLIQEPDLLEDKIKPQTSKAIKYESMTQKKKETEPIKETENRQGVESKKEMKKTIPAPKNVTKKTYESPKPSLGKAFWVILLVIGISLAFWVLWSNRSAMNDKDKKLNQIELFDTTVYEDVKPEEFKNTIEDSVKIEAEIAAKVDSMSKADKAGKPKAEKTKPSVKSEETKTAVKPVLSSNVEKDNFPVFITMGKGDMLTQLSLKYYGHKAFWVYIYAANRNVIADPNHVPLGTKIRIPKPDPSRINANDPNCIAKAKALQTKIVSMQNK